MSPIVKILCFSAKVNFSIFLLICLCSTSCNNTADTCPDNIFQNLSSLVADNDEKYHLDAAVANCVKGRMPLIMYAAVDGKVLKHLIDKGANVNAVYNQSDWGPLESFLPGFLVGENWSVLQFAVRQRNYESVKLLVDSGAEVSWKNNRGYDAIHDAQVSYEIEKTEKNKLILEYLKKKL